MSAVKAALGRFARGALPVPLVQGNGEVLAGESDERARFRSFYAEHVGLVRKVAFDVAGPDMLEEIVQEVFLKLWKGLAGFRAEAKASTWIYKVATNTALDFRRAMSRRGGTGRRTELTGNEPSNISGGTDEGALDAAALVDRGLASLSDEQRAVVVLAYLHERPLEEVAAILGIPVGTVKSRLHHARAKLRAILAPQGVEP